PWRSSVAFIDGRASAGRDQRLICSSRRRPFTVTLVIVRSRTPSRRSGSATPSKRQSATRTLLIGDSANPFSSSAYLLLRLGPLRTFTARPVSGHGAVAHVHVAQDRRIGAVAPLFVVEVGGDDRFGHLADGDVAHGDALDQPAAGRVGLEPQHAIEARAVHAALLREDVPRAAGDLAADDDAAVPVAHVAVADDDVLDRRVQPPSVVVAAGLERDAVVAGVERALLDQHVAARFGVAAVVVGAVAVD